MAKRSWDRMTVKLYRLFEQGADQPRLVQYVKNRIRSAKVGVSLHTKGTNFKSNACTL
jgi:hypothetical protein